VAYRGTPRSANIAQTALRGAERRYFAPMVASGGVLGSSVTDALNRATAYTYGATGAVLTVTDPLNQVTTNVYDVAGQLASTTYSNAATHSAVRTYNAAGRVTKENTTLYAYDAAGELTKNGATTQGYDAASQLTTAVVGSTSTAYTFDARGDRAKATTGSAVTSYGYDQANRLTSFARGTTTASYTYNGDSLRASKKVGSTTTKFVYDTAQGLPLVLSDGAYYYLYGPDGVPFEQVTTAGTVTYLHADQLGSIRMITGSTGKSVGTATYTAYGTRTTTGTTSVFGYAGQYTDTESGLQWLRARYYDPTTGQFLTVDPLTAATGARYAYAAGNPITRADPSGLMEINDGASGYVAAIGDFWTSNSAPPRAPDYYTLCGGASPFIVIPSARLTVTSSGHIHVTLSDGLGIPGANAQVGAGWIDSSEKPSSCEIDTFIDDVSASANGFVPVWPAPGVFGVGPGVTETWGQEGQGGSRSFGTEVTIGGGTASAGVSQGRTWRWH